MRFWANDIDKIGDLLKRELKKGNMFVAYNAELHHARATDLHFFPDSKRFEEFSKQNNSEHTIYFEWSIKHVLNCIEAIQNNKIDFYQNPRFEYTGDTYTIYDPMNVLNQESLKQQLTELGFSRRLFSALEFYNELGQEDFYLLQRERSENEKTRYLLHFEQDKKTLEYQLTNYEATLRIAPEIPDITINGINAKELDKEMKTIDWSIDHYADSLVEDYLQTQEGVELLEKIESILKKVNNLYDSGGEGKDAADKLMYKHWYGEVWEPTKASLEHIRFLYQWKQNVDLQVNSNQTKHETYENLKQNASRTLFLYESNKELLQVYFAKGYGKPDKHQLKAEEELPFLSRSAIELNRDLLILQLNKIGINEFVHDELERKCREVYEEFDISIRKGFDSDKVTVNLLFENTGNWSYLFKGYDATLYHYIPIEHTVINGINTQHVEDAMRKADWYYEYTESTTKWEKGFAEVERIKDALKAISCDEKGLVIAIQLWNNYVPLFTVGKPAYISKCEEENEMYVVQRFSFDTNINDAHRELKETLAVRNAILAHDALQSDHEVYPHIIFQGDSCNEIKDFLKQEKLAGNHWVAYCDNQPVISKDDLQCFRSNFEVHEFCYESSTDLDSYSFHSIYRMEKELNKYLKHQQISQNNIQQEVTLKTPQNESQLNHTVMTEKELSMIENQLKHVGLKEAFTPDLINRMKKGESYIEYPFTKNYDGDEAKATLHIKKSDTSNLYFFNKFDLSVRKDGQTAEFKQTFFINDFHRRPIQNGNENKYSTTFTFKEAFNYLSGRPVWKNFKNGNDEQYNAWLVANLKNILPNGSPEQKPYNQNYPFDLEKVMNNFAIWELTNKTYKDRLVESLQRGNLQLVTFIGENKEKEKLYISPNIPFGSLKVYDQDKQPVPTQTLVEKGYIGKEFAEKLKERVQEFKQKNGHEQSQKNKQKEKQTTNDETKGEKVSKENKQKKQTQTEKNEKPKQRQHQKMH